MIDFELKRIILRSSEDREIIVVGEQVEFMSNLVSTMKAEKLLGKGYEAYLVFVIGSQDKIIGVHEIHTV